MGISSAYCLAAQACAGLRVLIYQPTTQEGPQLLAKRAARGVYAATRCDPQIEGVKWISSGPVLDLPDRSVDVVVWLEGPRDRPMREVLAQEFDRVLSRQGWLLFGYPNRSEPGSAVDVWSFIDTLSASFPANSMLAVMPWSGASLVKCRSEGGAGLGLPQVSVLEDLLDAPPQASHFISFVARQEADLPSLSNVSFIAENNRSHDICSLRPASELEDELVLMQRQLALTAIGRHAAQMALRAASPKHAEIPQAKTHDALASALHETEMHRLERENEALRQQLQQTQQAHRLAKADADRLRTHLQSAFRQTIATSRVRFDGDQHFAPLIDRLVAQEREIAELRAKHKLARWQEHRLRPLRVGGEAAVIAELTELSSAPSEVNPMEFAQSEPVLATTFEKSAAEDSSEFDRAEVPIEQEQDPPNAEPAQVAANSWSPAIVVGEAAAVARPLIEVATRIKPNARILRLPREDEPEKKTS